MMDPDRLAPETTENVVPNPTQNPDQLPSVQAEKSQHSTIRRSYTANISRNHPTLILFMLDQSGSMANDYSAGLSRSEYLAHVVDQLLEELAARCNRAGGLRDYFHIALVGYGDGEIRNLVEPLSSEEA